jgi:hypothetical protein
MDWHKIPTKSKATTISNLPTELLAWNVVEKYIVLHEGY